ncbi:MAG: DUF4340 domain-containing protein [Deltaproteobacteria bacterium]|jgi:hypothetical protein|nr:DUF4340 domain-containing protein [Deltaproteobacteria bacterium]
MNPKTTAVLFAIAAALAAFVYFYEIRGEQARVEAKAAEKRLFPDVEQAEITSISLRTSDAPEIRLERRDGRWRIVAPLDFAADTFAADGIASAITQLMRESVIEDPQPLDVYGFREDGAEVRFAVGGVEKTLRIGSATPVGSNSYALVGGDDRVYTVASYQFSPFKKRAADFRDKRILEFDMAAVRRAAISWPGAEVVIERGEEGWRMVAPTEARADAEAVDGLLMSLSLLRASGFVDEPGSDEEMGFAPPQFAVELELSREAGDSDAEIARLAVGGVDESGAQRFVRGAAQSLYLISQESLDGFPRRVVEYRDRRLAKFAAEDARRIELGFHTESGETVAVSLHLEGGDWVSSADPVRSEKLDALVDVLSDLRAHDIVAEGFGPAELRAMGFDPARAVIQVYGEGEAAERLAEIQLGVAFGEGVTARVAERETVFLIATALAEAIPANLDDYRAHFVAQPEPATDE